MSSPYTGAAATPKVFALSRAFALQYSSLILIILAAVAAAFARDQIKTNAAPKVTSASVPVADSARFLPLSELYYPKFLSPDGRIADGNALYALREFLREHDVAIEISLEIGRQSSQHYQAALSQGFKQTQNLISTISGFGVPESAIKVYVVTSGQPDSVRVRFFKQKIEER